jgi:iron complex outermembrane receptor protein
MKTMKRYRFLIFLILGNLIVQFSFAQAVLKGKVKDKANGETLVGSVVSVEGKAMATDLDGNYSLQLSSGEQKVSVKMVGYIALNLIVTLKEGENTQDFFLEQSSLQLDQVVISAGKYEQKLSEVTVSMEVLKPATIDARNTTNLNTMVDQVSGVAVIDDQVNIRGGSGYSYGAGSRVLMLVDEMPMLAADAGDIKWNYLPVENLEQIEVIKGASSALFGSSALNGVINIRTAFPRDKPQTKIIAFSGVYDKPRRKNLVWWKDANPIQTGTSFFHSRKAGNLDVVVGGNFFSDQGYRLEETEQRGRLNANLRYNFPKIPGLSIGVNMNGMISKGGLYILWENADSGGYKPQAGTISNYLTKRSNIDPFITYTTVKGGKHTLRTRYFNTTNTNNTNQESIAELYYAEYQYKKEFRNNWILNAGLMGTKSVVVSDSLYGNHVGRNVAVYSQLDKRFNRLTLSLGVRGEYFKIDDVEAVNDINLVYLNKIGQKQFVDTGRTYSVVDLGRDTINIVRGSKVKPVFRFGLNYRIAEATFLRASMGQGYRFPSVAEKFVATSVGALSVFPNENLLPENGFSAEIGIKQGFKLGSWTGFVDVAGFWTEYRNMMEFSFGIWFPDTASVSYQNYVLNKVKYLGFKSVNVGNARITGTEISAAVQGKIGPVKVSFFGGYTYTKPVNLNYNPNDTTGLAGPFFLKYRFFHLAKGDVQLEYKMFSAGLATRYNSFMINIDDSFEKDVSSYFIPFPLGIYILPGLEKYRKIHRGGNLTFDLRFGVEVNEKSRVSLIVNNLLNAENMSRPGDLQPPRMYMIQYLIQF